MNNEILGIQAPYIVLVGVIVLLLGGLVLLINWADKQVTGGTL